METKSLLESRPNDYRIPEGFYLYNTKNESVPTRNVIMTTQVFKDCMKQKCVSADSEH